MDIQAYLAMAAALAAGAVVKGATGMGLPLVALPALTAIFGLQHAISVLIVPILVTNAWQVWRFRAARQDTRLGFVPLLVLGGIGGVAIGTWALVALPERQLLFVLGVLLTGYVLLRLSRPALRVDERVARTAALPVGVGAGVLQGATGISAPIGVTFIHAMRLTHSEHVYAVSAMFLGFAVVQAAALAVSGISRPEWWLQGLLALVPILAFMPLGQWLAGKLSATAFDRLVLVFLAAIGVKLLLGV
jgi:uncharacterized membrane protein YfcA